MRAHFARWSSTATCPELSPRLLAMSCGASESKVVLSTLKMFGSAAERPSLLVEGSSSWLRLDLRIQQPSGVPAVVEVLDVNRLLSASSHHPRSWIHFPHRNRSRLTVEVERCPGP